MARFRFHRGSLADSKATEIEANSLKELEEFVNLHKTWFKETPKSLASGRN